MNIFLVFGIVCAAILIYKLVAFMERNALSKLDKIKFTVSASMIGVFIITTRLFPFPENLYWFVLFALVVLAVLLTSRMIRQELKRYWSLNRKDQILNLLYYPLLVAVIAIVF
ncbi:hypothetical protein [Sediminibacter sp. Hel_I_10]|uniref:hypothetical protein n=1 Tax=Sediminibacter sp. Hel_I_10 TaxID=1392490 RepID=UPI00047E3561|nr:hypothetical protein [Sediminibacter sp. Hel_I_10]